MDHAKLMRHDACGPNGSFTPGDIAGRESDRWRCPTSPNRFATFHAAYVLLGISKRQDDRGVRLFNPWMRDHMVRRADPVHIQPKAGEATR